LGNPGDKIFLDMLTSCPEATLKAKRLEKIKSRFNSYPVTK